MKRDRQTAVCLLTETYHPVIGGGEAQARALATGLGRHGIAARVLTRRSDAAFASRESVDGIPVRRLGPTGPGHLKKWAMLPGLLVELLRSGRRDDVLLVCGFRVLGIAAVLAGRWLGKRVVLKADNSGEMSGDYFKAGAAKLGLAGAPRLVARFVALRNRLFLKADAFVAMSSEMRAEFEAYGVPADRITTIPNSVDPARFRRTSGEDKAAARRRLGLPADALIVVFTGRLLRSKGVLELTRVWGRLVQVHPRARLVIVGSGQGLMHDCEPDLHALIRCERLEGSIVTTGFVRNVEDYLKAADIFAFPTTDEAFGIALIEAMAAGLAVVATRVGGIPDIIQPERNGLLIEPGDEHALHAALQQLLDNGALRDRLGAAAVTTVEERYTTEAVLRRYASLLGILAAGGTGRRRSAITEPSDAATGAAAGAADRRNAHPDLRAGARSD